MISDRDRFGVAAFLIGRMRIRFSDRFDVSGFSRQRPRHQPLSKMRFDAETMAGLVHAKPEKRSGSPKRETKQTFRNNLSEFPAATQSLTSHETRDGFNLIHEWPPAFRQS